MKFGVDCRNAEDRRAFWLLILRYLNFHARSLPKASRPTLESRSQYILANRVGMMVCYLSFAIMVMRRSNLDPVARQTCARLNAQQGSPRQALHGGVEHHWHVVATQPEVGSLPKQAWRIRRFAPTASLPPAVTGARDTGCALLPVQPRNPKSEVAHGTRRFIACTDSVTAARSNVAAEMSRAITCTVLFDRTAASNSIERVDDTSDAVAGSPAPYPVHRDVDQRRRPRRQARPIP